LFTGIIEATAQVISCSPEGSGWRFTLESALASELKIDQSLAHNGVCLTVVHIDAGKNQYEVTAIAETLAKTNLGDWQPGTFVNLERAARMGDRLDGHIVQGHVDATGICTSILDRNQSWEFRFSYAPGAMHTTVPKGSICINGVSLTVVDSQPAEFSVAIIPYTFANTNFHKLSVGQSVNLEFDIIGKYIATLLQRQHPSQA